MTEPAEKTATGLPAVRAEEDTDAMMTAWRDTEPDARSERLPAVDRWNTMAAIATKIANSSLLPAHIRNSPDREANVMLLLLTAHDLGISATTAIQKIVVIDGKPAMGADLMRSLILRESHGLTIKVERDENGRPYVATIRGYRREMPDLDLEASFTIHDAAAAGLCSVNENGTVRARSSKGNPLPWESYTEDMLVARATSRYARRFFPDCLSGVSYTPDELEAVPNLAAPPVESADEETLQEMREKILGFGDGDVELGDAIRAEVKARWEAARLGSVKPGARRPLSAAEVNAAWVILREAADSVPAEAEIVDPADPHSAGPDGGGAGQRTDESVQPHGVGSLKSARGDAADPSPEVVEQPAVADAGSLPVPTAAVEDGDGGAAPLANAALKSSYGDGRPQTDVDLPPSAEDATGAQDAAQVPVTAAGEPRAPDAQAHTVEAITAEVEGMPLDAVHRALGAAKLSVNGTPKTLRNRLTKHLVAERPF